MERFIGRYVKIIMVAALLLSYASIQTNAATYKYIPLKENAAKISQLTAKSTGVFKTYKAVVIKDKLSIQKKASTSSKTVGVYKLGSIVEIKGKAGSFLKTAAGYVKMTGMRTIEGMYMKAARDSGLVNATSLKSDARVVQAGRTYRITGAKGGYLKVKVGRMNEYVPMSITGSISDVNNAKVTIGWDMISKKSGNESLLSDGGSYVNMKAKAVGLDVLSPTWFDITGSATSSASIDIVDIADKKYVETAHGNGYEVWVRFCEMDKKRAALIFKDSNLRARIIDKLIKLATQYDVDGINVDFEALGKDNKDGFTAFMKELYPKIKKYDMNVSVDVTKISQTSSLYSLCYDRPALAKYSDYLMLMAYDEYYSSSPEAGSVGSYQWVQEAIEDILNEGVPAGKLVLGAPFYLRDFSVAPYDIVLANPKVKIYSSSNTAPPVLLGSVKKDDRFKYIGSYSNWYIISYGGKNGYVLKNNTQLYKANTVITTPGAISTTEGGISVTTGTGIGTGQGGAITFVITEDTVVMTGDVKVYSAANVGMASVLGETGTKDYFKYAGGANGCYKVTYKGTNGYIKTSEAALYKAGTRTVGSSAASMQTALDRISQYNGQINYDSLAKQKVGTYVKDGLKHYVWLETADSMKWRMEFVNKYKLPGAAFWSLYWKTTDGIWDTIRNTLKK